MKIALLCFVLLQAARPKPTPTPEWMKDSPRVWEPSNVASALTFSDGLSRPRMVIHFSGNTVLEINKDGGKTLKVSADGTVTGNMPHDKAADEFWRAIATLRPKPCKPESRP